MLKTEAVTKSFVEGRRDRLAAVDHVTLSVEKGTFFTLLGPSGCGKTTLLRMIAGIETPDSGRITIDGKTVFSSDPPVNRAPNKRKIGLVFQNFAIWPHMTVMQHVTFPLEMIRKEQGLSRADIVESAHQNLAMVQLAQLADKNASLLSGGQKQRLAVARALVAKPKIVLLDEPLSNLDAVLRETLRGELKTLQRTTGITFIYVTHDQDEALAMSDQVGVMRDGRILQIASPQDIYQRPLNAFVAGFVGKGTVLSGMTLKAFMPAQVLPGDRDFLVRPEKVTVCEPADAPLDAVPGTIVAIDFYGDHWRIVVDCLGRAIAAKATAERTFSVGQQVRLSITPGGIIPYN